MKMIKWCVYGALGTCSVLAALVAQPVQAAEQYAYFSMDAGVALVPDIEVKEFVGVKLPSSFALDKATFSMSQVIVEQDAAVLQVLSFRQDIGGDHDVDLLIRAGDFGFPV